MIEMLAILGFSMKDIFMLILSMFCGMLGANVRAYMLEGKLSDYETKTKTWRESFNYRDFQWYLYHLLVGLVTGLLVALLFVGAINEDKGSVARVLAFALLMGYSAPTIWMKQGNALEKIIDNRIAKLKDDKTF